MRLSGVASLAALIVVGACGRSRSEDEMPLGTGGMAAAGQGARAGSAAGNGEANAGRGGDNGASGGESQGGEGAEQPGAGQGGRGDGDGGGPSGDAGASVGGTGDAGASVGGAGGAGGAGASTGGSADCVVASGSLDIDVPVVTISGSITVNGRAPPNAGSARISLVAGDDKADIALIPSETYSADIVPGTYDLAYTVFNRADGIPDNWDVVFRRNVTIDHTQELDIDIPMVVVSGKLSVDGQPLAAGGSEAFFYFRNTDGGGSGGVSIDSGTYSTGLIPASYDVVYSSRNDDGDIDQQAAIFTGVPIDADRNLDVDIPTITLSGSLTADGVPAGGTSLYLTNDEGDLAVLGDVLQPAYSTRVIPGTYDLRVGVAPSVGFHNDDLGAPLARVTVDDSTTLDVHVPVVTISGGVTLNGAPAPVTTDAALYLAGSSNNLVEVASLNGPIDPVTILPGTYDVVYRGPSVSYSDDGIPDNPSAVLQRGLEILASGTVDLDVPMVVVIGDIGVNGEPGSTGTIYFEDEEEDRFPAGAVASSSYRGELIPGTYSVHYRETTGQDALLLRDVALEATTTLDIDVPISQLAGWFRINGAQLPISPAAAVWLMGPTTSWTLLDELRPHYDTEVIAGTYDLRYGTLRLDEGLPSNSFANLGCVLVR